MFTRTLEASKRVFDRVIPPEDRTALGILFGILTGLIILPFLLLPGPTPSEPPAPAQATVHLEREREPEPRPRPAPEPQRVDVVVRVIAPESIKVVATAEPARSQTPLTTVHDRVPPPRVPRATPQVVRASHARSEPIAGIWIMPANEEGRRNAVSIRNDPRFAALKDVQINYVDEEAFSSREWQVALGRIGTPPVVAWFRGNLLVNWTACDDVETAINGLYATRGQYP